jgi:hypothetical protein
MNLLAELHAEPDLKLNLKFEIEVSSSEYSRVRIPVFRIQNLWYVAIPDTDPATVLHIIAKASTFLK